jgi:acetolactate synthase-1/2/3 large subunit
LFLESGFTVFESGQSTGARLVLDLLADEGVETIFGYPGGAIMPLYDALLEHPLQHVLTRHEAAAAFAAGGYARSTGRVGVCVATSGPGATNLITGLLDAQMDSIPLVAITGQVRTSVMGTDAFQEADITSIAGPVTKRSVCVRDAASLERTLRAAFRLARGPRPGPVLVDIPTDILKAAVAALGPRPHSPHAAPARPDDAALDAALALLHGARKPVAIAGGGVRSAGATALYRELCARFALPHVATINALGCATPGDPNFLGMLGMHGWKAANLAVAEADVLLAFGMRFDDRVTGRPDRFARNARIVHADIDAAEIGKIVATEVALAGDLRETLALLLQRSEATRGTRAFGGWAAEARAYGSALPVDRAPAGALSATAVCDALFAMLPPDAIVATDVGQHQMWAAQRQRASDPRHFLTSAGLGTMGFGLPAAIGAQFAHPGRTVVAIAGDGGFQMSLSELATLRRYELPVKIVLIDNRRLGMVRQWQDLFYDKRYSATDLSDNPDFVALAAAFGVRAECVAEPAQMGAALARLLAAREPMLLHCACYPAENCWPLIPPGASAHEALGPEALEREAAVA